MNEAKTNMAETSVLTTLLYPGRENKDKREVTIKIYIHSYN